MPRFEAVVPPAEAVIYLVNLAAVATLVCSVGLLTVRSCRRRSAPLRHGILLGTLALILASPAAVWLAKQSGVALIRVAAATPAGENRSGTVWKTRPLAARRAILPAQEPASRLSEPAPLPSLERTAAVTAVRPSMTDSPPAATQSEASTPDRREVRDRRPSAVSFREDSPTLTWWQVLGGAAAFAWAAVAAVASVRLGWGCLALARFCRRLAPLPDVRQELPVRQAADALGLRKPPKVFVSRWVSVPVSIGLLRPAIVLPDPMAGEMDAGQLEAILLHEMAHIVRRDHWVGVAQRIATALFWWNPLVHRVCEEISELREEICDNCVVLVQGEGQRLARILVDVAARTTIRPLLPSTLGILQPKLTGLTRRVARLVDEERNMETRMSFKSKVSVLTCGLLVLFGMATIGGLRLAHAQPGLQTEPAAADSSSASSPSAPAEIRSPKPVADVSKAKQPTQKPADAGAKAGAWLGARVGELVKNQAAGNRPTDPDAENIEGTWEVAECRQGGKALEKAALSRIAFVGGRFQMREDSKTIEGAYTIDSAKHPEQLVLRPSGAEGNQRVLRIAMGMKAGRLVLCFDPRPGAPAPVALETKEGDGRFLITLKPLLVRRFQGHTGPVCSVRFSRDGKQAVSGSGWPWGDRTIRLWDVATGRQTLVILTAMAPVKSKGWGPREVPGEVLSVAFAPDASQVLAGGCGGFVGLWNLTTGVPPRFFEGHNRTTCAVAFSADGRRALSGGCDNLVRLWDVASGKELKRLQGHGSWVRTVAFSPDGRRALSGGLDRTMRLWDLETGREVQRMSHDAWVWSVAFSPDGRCGLSACGGNRRPRGRQARAEPGAETKSGRTADTPDSSTVEPIRLWDLQTGRVLRRFRGHPFGTTAVAFSPDGRRIVSGGYDRAVRLWDVQTGSELCTYLGHRDWVWSVAFSPDGRQVLSAGGGFGDAQAVAPGSDFAVRLWRLP